MTASVITERMPLAEADQLATAIIGLLGDACDRIQVVGSTRRRLPTCKDVELLVAPKYANVEADLFGGVVSISLLEQRTTALRDEGTFDANVEHKAWGPRLKRFNFHERQIELFVCLPPTQWGLASLVRTGPGDFSHQLVTNTNITILDSMRGKRSGLLPVGHKVRDFGIYYGLNLVPTKEEEDVFRVIGRPFIPAEQRR